MKINVTTLIRLLPLILIIATVTTGCNRRGRLQTVLPGRSGGVGEEGLQRPRRPGGNTDLTTPPIGGPGANPGINTFPTPIPVDPGQIPTDTGAGRGDWEGLVADPSKFANENVYFDFDRYVIKPGEVEKIRVVATHLKANPSHRVQVDGHCDERGTEEYNRALGEKRAQAVREFLAREGVAPERVRTVSYGEDKPADPSHNDAAWTRNRRAEFILMTPPSTF